MSNNYMYPMYSTKTFMDFYPSFEDFIEDYKSIGIPVTISDISLQTLYYLLYAKYGNNPVANNDENQFKYKLFSIIYQHGSTWETKQTIQEKLRDLMKEGNEAELLSSSKAIFNHALNPGTEPSTESLEQLSYINDQSTSNYRKSKMNAYMELWELLRSDITEIFLNKFLTCFKKFVSPEDPLSYVTEIVDEEV